MTLDQFITKYNGKYIDYDHAYGPQCVDLMRQYTDEVLRLPQLPRAKYAKDIFKQFKTDSNFKKIFNTPTGVPKRGDIIFWDWRWPVTGIAGHVAVFSGGNTSRFIAFTQNYPTNSPCRFYNYDYRGVMGWITPLK